GEGGFAPAALALVASGEARELAAGLLLVGPSEEGGQVGKDEAFAAEGGVVRHGNLSGFSDKAETFSLTLASGWCSMAAPRFCPRVPWPAGGSPSDKQMG